MMSNKLSKLTLIAILIVAAALVMALAGCGSDDDDESGDESGALSVRDAWVRASVPMESGAMDDMDAMDEDDAEASDDESSDMDDMDDDSDTDADDMDSMDEDDAEASDDESSDMDAMDDMSGGEHAMAGAVTGAFMVIENSTDSAERLVSAAVSEDIASVVEIHETTLDENDVMQMRPVEGIDVPANGSVELKPGSYHIMLIDVQTALNPGDTVTLTLTFESGTTLTVEADVREMSS